MERSTGTGVRGRCAAAAVPAPLPVRAVPGMRKRQEVCTGLSRSGSSSVDDMANGGHDHLSPAAAPVAAAPVQAAPGTKNVGGYDVVYPDRGKVISRYKEKRKNRMYVRCIREMPRHTSQIFG